MILTVTLNFAIDVTYAVEAFERGATTRVPSSTRRAGGKGVNVARVLHALGSEVLVSGLAGGFTGRAAVAELDQADIPHQLTEIDGESRLTFIVVEADGRATGFSETGPDVSEVEWATFRHQFEELLDDAQAVVLSGSLPAGAPPSAYAELITAARAKSVPTLLDADGEALRRGAAAGPEIVKVNADELRAAVDENDLVKGAGAMLELGARAAVITDGWRELVALVDEHTVLRARPPQAVKGNATGAGDAASAALIRGLLDGTPWPERLADAAALSAAAVSAAQAGSFDRELYERWTRPPSH